MSPQIQEDLVTNQASANIQLRSDRDRFIAALTVLLVIDSIVILVCLLLLTGLLIPDYRDTASSILTKWGYGTDLGVFVPALGVFVAIIISLHQLRPSKPPYSLAKNGKVDILINYISIDKYWTEWLKWKLEQWSYAVLLLEWDHYKDFREKLCEKEKELKVKRILSLFSSEMLEFLENPGKQEWFHNFKEKNHKESMNALVCIRDDAYNKLQIYDKELRLLNFADKNAYFITEQQAELLLKHWLPTNGDKPRNSDDPYYPGTRPDGWHLLPRHEPNFVGREDLLRRLQRALVPAKARILLSGLRGSGKTALAKEYIHRNYDRYRYVFWLDISRRQYRNQLASIITLLDISMAPTQNDEDAFIDWLSIHDGWLLILNGYVNSAKICKFWERELQGKLLVTAPMRITEVNFCPECEIVVPSMENQEAEAFLKSRTLPKDYEATPAMEEAIQTIVQKLGGLPEALLAASLYIKSNGHDFTQYIVEYQKRREAYEQNKMALGQQTYASRVQGKELDVIYSWWYYFDKVEKESPEAANLLRYCTMLDPVTIYIEIIDNIPASKLPDSRGAIRKLSNYFLIQRKQEKLSVDLHIKNFFQDRLDDDTKKDLSIDIMQALSKTLESTSIPNMQRAPVYSIQFDICRGAVQKYKIKQLVVADLYDSYGHYLIESARYQEAEKLLDDSWQRRQQLQNGVISGITQKDLDLKKATNRSHVAELLRLQGKYTPAKDLLETEVLPVRKRILPQNDFELVTTYYHLAQLAYVLDIKTDFAEYCNTLANTYKGLDAYGNWQRHTLPASNAVLLLKQQGSISYMQASSAKSKQQGSTSSHIQTNSAEGAKYSESIRYYDEAISIATKTLEDLKIQGLEKETLQIEIKICEARKGRCYVALRDAQQYKKIEEQYIRLLHVYTETFNINRHPVIAQTYLDLAELYKIQNENDLAKDYYNKALDIYKRIQKYHPQIAQIYIYLGALYTKKRGYSLAKEYYDNAIDVYKTIQKDHPLIKDIQELINRLPLR